MHDVERVYARVEEIARRTENLNPSKLGCMDGVLDFLRAHEIGCAVDDIYQGILNADQHLLVDISFHDLVYLLSIEGYVRSGNENLKLEDFGVMAPYILKEYYE